MPDCVVYCCACGCRMNPEMLLSTSGEVAVYENVESDEGPISFRVALILCALPIPGLARFYTGYPFIGLFQLIVYPIGFVWSFIDMVRMLTNRFRDGEGRLLRGYSGRFACVVALVVILTTTVVVSQLINDTPSDAGTNASKSSVSDNSLVKSNQAEQVSSPTSESVGSTDVEPVVVAESDEAKDNGDSKQIVETKKTVLMEKEKESTKSEPAQQQDTVTKIDKAAEMDRAAKQEEEKKKAIQAKIADLHITKYPETAKELKKEGFPKMLKKYGVNGIKKINKLLPKVAEKAAQNPTMDKIAWVDVSDNKSTKNKLVFYAQANNSNRVYISEDELNSDAPVYSNHEKLKALLHIHEEMCEQVIKSCLTHPSTYNKSLLNSASETQEYGNVIRIGFSAKNSFNLEIEYEAVFRVNADSEIVYQSIEERK